MQSDERGPLKPKDAEDFLHSGIDGDVFTRHPGDRDFFKEVGLHVILSDKIARLAKKTVEGPSNGYHQQEE